MPTTVINEYQIWIHLQQQQLQKDVILFPLPRKRGPTETYAKTRRPIQSWVAFEIYITIILFYIIYNIRLPLAKFNLRCFVWRQLVFVGTKGIIYHYKADAVQEPYNIPTGLVLGQWRLNGVPLLSLMQQDKKFRVLLQKWRLVLRDILT